MNTIEEQEEHHEKLFLRVRLCGALHIEWVHPLTAEVVPVAEVVAGERDRTAALCLLALLLAQPNRHAYRDWIMEQFWPDQVRSTASHRLENVFSILRKLLRSPSGGESLLHSIRSNRAKGVLYALDTYPHIWADVDALVWNGEQAARMERFGDDALPLWERAFALLKRGPYLPDEPYTEWAKEQRERLDGYYRQCVHALWRLYTTRQGQAGKAEALLLLRTYWQQHKTDEDALRPLLELLGEQERYQEAETYYQQLLLALDELGPDEQEQPREPDSRTHDIREYLCTKQIQRQQSWYQLIPQEREPSTSLVSSILQVTSNTPSFNQQGIGDSLVQFYERNGEDVSQREQRDWALWFGLQVAQILSIIRLWSKQTEDFTGEIQTLVDHEIKAMDETLEQFRVQNEQSMSRRQALVAIAALPIMFASGLVTDIAVEDFLSQAAASIIACWHLLRGNGLTSVSEIIPKFAPALRTLALRPSQYQQSSARLAAQTAILQAILAMHKLNVAAREAHCNDAIKYSDIAKDPRLQAVTRMYLGYTLSFCYWPRKPEKALPIFQQALHALGREESLIRSDILMGMAEAYAQCKEEQQALHYIGLAKEHFPSYPEHDQSFIYAECGLTTLYQWEGKMFLELSEQYPDRDYQIKARDALMQSIGTSSLSDRCTTETIIYQADSARITGELPIYTSALRTAAQMAFDIGSKRRYSEALIVFQRTPHRWVNEPQVQVLAREIFKQLPGGNR